MSWTFLRFPDDPKTPGEVAEDWSDPTLVAALRADQQAQLRSELRQMAEWNRRAALLKVTAANGATPEQEQRAEREAALIDDWFWNSAWEDAIDAATKPVTMALDPASVAALAKAARRARQDLAGITAAISALKIATLLLSSLKADAGQTVAAPAAAAMAPAWLSALQTTAGAQLTDEKDSEDPKTVVAQADALQKQAAALKAMYDAMEARVGANEALVKSALGTIAPSVDAAAKMTAGENAGLLEGTLLAANVINISARRIADEVKAALDGSTPALVVHGGTGALDVAMWRAVKARIAALEAMVNEVETQLAATEAALSRAPSGGPIPANFPLAPLTAAITTFGVLLGNAANLASYFQTSFTVTGEPVEGVDDQLLVAATARCLSKSFTVYLPGASPNEAKAFALIETISTFRQRADVAIARLDSLDAAITPPAAPPNAKALALAAGARGAATAVTKACDALLNSLITPDANGVLPLGLMASQATLGAILDAGAKIVRVKVHQVSHGLYVREDGRLTAFFRRRENDSPEMEVAGGAVISFTLQEADGKILTAASLRDQSSYLRLNMVDSWLEDNDI